MASRALGQVQQPRPLWQVMSVYWLAQYAAWLGILTPVIMTIALKIGQIAPPSQKAEWLGLILSTGAATAMIATPIWGAISDHTRSRLGRRKLWIILGSAMLLTGLTIMTISASPLIFGVGWLFCQIGSNAAQAALNAVLSDVIPEEKHGLMSALLGASATAAISTGVFIVNLTGTDPQTMFLVPWLLSPLAIMLFVMVVPDAPALKVDHHAFSLKRIFYTPGRNPLRSGDFTWALISRFLVMSSWSFALTYQVFFLTDRLHVAPSEVAGFMTLSTSLMGLISLALSCVAGWLSDLMHRRKIFVIVAAFMMMTGFLGAALATNFEQFLAAVALISIGQGLYYAVDIALCVEVLPNREDVARDMGLLQIANSLPQSIVPAIGPILLGLGVAGLQHANYFALFGTASACALIGALAIMPIRGVR